MIGFVESGGGEGIEQRQKERQKERQNEGKGREGRVSKLLIVRFMSSGFLCINFNLVFSY